MYVSTLILSILKAFTVRPRSISTYMQLSS